MKRNWKYVDRDFAGFGIYNGNECKCDACFRSYDFGNEHRSPNGNITREDLIELEASLRNQLAAVEMLRSYMDLDDLRKIESKNTVK